MRPSVETSAHLSPYTEEFTANPHPLWNRVLRVLWSIFYSLSYRPSPNVAHRYRVFLLRLFGANVHRTAHPYPKCRIWAPWRLTMGPNSCLATMSIAITLHQLSLKSLRSCRNTVTYVLQAMTSTIGRFR